MANIWCEVVCQVKWSGGEKNEKKTACHAHPVNVRPQHNTK